MNMDTEKRAMEARLRELEAQRKLIVETYQAKVDLAEEFGGILTRTEVENTLGVSYERARQLVNRGEFRNRFGLYSKADVERYCEERRPGRPRNDPDQASLPL